MNMSRKKTATHAEFVKVMTELQARHPDRARMMTTLLEVQAMHGRLTIAEQSTMFLSAVAYRQPWMIDQAVKVVHGFYDKLAKTTDVH
jgi:hypothetical protein